MIGRKTTADSQPTTQYTHARAQSLISVSSRENLGGRLMRGSCYLWRGKHNFAFAITLTLPNSENLSLQLIIFVNKLVCMGRAQALWLTAMFLTSPACGLLRKIEKKNERDWLPRKKYRRMKTWPPWSRATRNSLSVIRVHSNIFRSKFDARANDSLNQKIR